MRLGFDHSSYADVLAHGGSFFIGEQRIDPVAYLHDHNGVDLMRLRLWVDPKNEKGEPYGGGDCDLPTVMKLAKEGRKKGYDLLLDFHFSDFWADPGKQFLPKSWVGQSLEELCVTLKEYVRKTLDAFIKEGIELYAIQIGNEITNGMCWPIAKLTQEKIGDKRGNYPALCALLRAGIDAVHEKMPKTKTLIHLERSYDQEVYKEFLDEILAEGIDFDILGMSYYPYWHGSFEMLFSNIDMLRVRYGKPIWIVETSYGFTEDPTPPIDGVPWLSLLDQDPKNREELLIPYPLTQDGQAEFLTELIRLGKEHSVEAIFYWEPFWLALPGLTWATYEGECYTKETHKPTHNERADQGLFDYDKKATKAFFAYRV